MVKHFTIQLNTITIGIEFNNSFHQRPCRGQSPAAAGRERTHAQAVTAAGAAGAAGQAPAAGRRSWR